MEDAKYWGGVPSGRCEGLLVVTGERCEVLLVVNDEAGEMLVVVGDERYVLVVLLEKDVKPSGCFRWMMQSADCCWGRM